MATKTVFFLIDEDDQGHSLNSPTRDVGRLGLEVLTSTEAQAIPLKGKPGEGKVCIEVPTKQMP